MEGSTGLFEVHRGEDPIVEYYCCLEAFRYDLPN